MRLAAERGVGILPAGNADQDVQMTSAQGNVSRPGETIAGLCLGDEIADELEAEALEEELAGEFPCPPGMQTEFTGSANGSALGLDLFAQPLGQPLPPATKEKKHGLNLGRFLRRRRNSHSSDHTASTSSAPSFCAVGDTPEPWSHSNFAKSVSSHHSGEHSASSRAPSGNLTSSSQSASTLYPSGTSNSQVHDKSGIRDFLTGISGKTLGPSYMPSKGRPTGESPETAAGGLGHDKQVKPTPILRPPPTSYSAPLKQDRGIIPKIREFGLSFVLQVATAVTDTHTMSKTETNCSRSASPSVPSQEANRPSTKRLDVSADIPVHTHQVANFPSQLKTLGDHVVHAGLVKVPLESGPKTSAAGEAWATALLVLTVHKAPVLPTGDDYDLKPHVHLFPSLHADKELDRPQFTRSNSTLTQRLQGKERLELNRHAITRATELRLSRQSGLVVASMGTAQDFQNASELTVGFSDDAAQKEWILQIKTVIAELDSNRASEAKENSHETDAPPRPSSTLSRRNSLPLQKMGSTGRPVELAEQQSNQKNLDVAHPLVQYFGGGERNKRHSFSSMESSVLPSVDSRRHVLQEARAQMAAKRLKTLQSGQLPSREGSITPSQSLNRAGAPPIDALPEVPRQPSTNAAAKLTGPPLSVLQPSSSGMLMYVDSATGKQYEVPLGMLEALLSSSKSIGTDNTGDHCVLGESIVPSCSDALARGTSPSVVDGRSSERTVSPYVTPTTPIAATAQDGQSSRPWNAPEDCNVYSSPSGHSGQTSTSSLGTLSLARMRQDSLSSSAFPPSPIVRTPPSSENMSVNSSNRDVGEDVGSLRTFGHGSERKKARRGNLRDRMKKMKNEHQMSGGTLDISEFISPWPWNQLGGNSW